MLLTNNNIKIFFPAHSSQAIVANGSVYLSGCLGLDKDTGALVTGGVGAETRKALENLQAILRAAGSGVEKVLKCTVYVIDLAEFGAVNEEYKKVFTHEFPARTCIQVSKLPLGGRVEIEAIALVGDVKTELKTVD